MVRARPVHVASQRFAFGHQTEIDGDPDARSRTQSHGLQRGDQGDQLLFAVEWVRAQDREAERAADGDADIQRGSINPTIAMVSENKPRRYFFL